MSDSDKITTKIASLPPTQPYFSLEFFPPKTAPGRENLNARLTRMARGLRPLFVTVTWGAGGSTAQKSLALAEVCQRQLGLTTCLHLTCTNMSRAVLDEALQSAKEIGVRNILALRGDPPRKDEYEEEDGGSNSGSSSAANADGSGAATTHDKDEDELEFVYAIDLVKYIRKHYGDYFCIGVAAYPEGHVDGFMTITPGDGSQDPLRDLPYLVEKVRAGADFIMTQLFYDVDAYLRFEKILRNHPSGIFASIPIIPGLMPIQSYQTLRRTTKLSNAAVPAHIFDKLESVKWDDEAVKTAGVDILCEIIEKIKAEPTGSHDTAGVGARRGFHFYTLNLEKVIAFVLEQSDLIPPDDSLEDAGSAVDSSGTAAINGALPSRRTRRASSIDPHNSVIIDDIRASLQPHQTTTVPPPPPSTGTMPPAPAISISEGEGSLGRLATWDDFPNGRFGDPRSPAFGEIDGYGPTLPLPLPLALQYWGHPTTLSDITTLFIKYLDGQVPALPWSSSPEADNINPETEMIREYLKKMCSKGWWTLASQPAVEAARSEDPVIGWGPKRGWVWQKAFVEFWMPKSEWPGLEAKLDALGKDKVSWYATDDGSPGAAVRTTDPAPAINAVTWGMFPGKEIVTATMVGVEAFAEWGVEAYALWDAWAALYRGRGRGRGRGVSEEGRFLRNVKGGVVLVNVIWHEFGEGEGDELWKTLLEEEEEQKEKEKDGDEKDGDGWYRMGVTYRRYILPLQPLQLLTPHTPSRPAIRGSADINPTAAGAGAYFYAKREINASRREKFQRLQQQQQLNADLEYSHSHALRSPDNDLAGQPSAEATSDPAPTRHEPETDAQRVKEKSKYEAAEPWRSRKGDRFS
ncbi:FAD-linked oxidoreductase-like protein [Kalaharituber pfeilii]|nr:FAD-linked oxidoreductase-like protein [Kalaharituber pfeilii]